MKQRAVGVAHYLHGGLIRFYIGQHIIVLYGISHLLVPGDNPAFRHRIAQQRHTHNGSVGRQGWLWRIGGRRGG